MSTKLKAGTSTSGAVLDADTTGILELQTGSTPTTAINIDAAQNVQLGSTTPASTGIPVTVAKAYNASTSPIGSAIALQRTDGTDVLGSIGFYNSAGTKRYAIETNVTVGNGMEFNYGASNKMYLDTSGNLLVGQTALSGAEKVGMTQSANGQVMYALASDSSTYTSSVALLRGARNTTNGTWSFLRCFNNGDKLYIYDSGNVVNANNSYGAISDVKLKENIVDATPKLKDLCKVKVRQYNLIGDDKKQIGVVAQELEEVFAGLVDESADKDQDGNDLGTTTKQVKYSVFVPMLIKAIQEQQAMIEELKTKVAALEAK